MLDLLKEIVTLASPCCLQAAKEIAIAAISITHSATVRQFLLEIRFFISSIPPLISESSFFERFIALLFVYRGYLWLHAVFIGITTGRTYCWGVAPAANRRGFMLIKWFVLN